MDYRWKRFRKWLKPLQNKEAYEQKVKRLHRLLSLAQTGRIDLYFGDESGFSLTACVPYGWIQKGQQAPILSQRSARINVFGLLSTNNELFTYQQAGSLNADFIECVDSFSTAITKPTVIVLDNASWHTAGVWQAKKEEWEQKGLFIFLLPRHGGPNIVRISTESSDSGSSSNTIGSKRNITCLCKPSQRHSSASSPDLALPLPLISNRLNSMKNLYLILNEYLARL